MEFSNTRQEIFELLHSQFLKVVNAHKGAEYPSPSLGRIVSFYIWYIDYEIEHIYELRVTSTVNFIKKKPEVLKLFQYQEEVQSIIESFGLKDSSLDAKYFLKQLEEIYLNLLNEEKEYNKTLNIPHT